MFSKSRFNLCKISMQGSYFSNIAGFLPATFSKKSIVTGSFQVFYQDLSHFLLQSMFPEDHTMANSVTFKKFFQELNSHLLLQT